MNAAAFSQRRELAHRSSDGIEVTLFWSKPSDQITIAIVDTRSDEALEFEVVGTAALDAFNHPYAYAAAHHAHDRATSHRGAGTQTASTDWSRRP
jgi:hypothetical protein